MSNCSFSPGRQSRASPCAPPRRRVGRPDRAAPRDPKATPQSPTTTARSANTRPGSWAERRPRVPASAAQSPPTKPSQPGTSAGSTVPARDDNPARPPRHLPSYGSRVRRELRGRRDVWRWNVAADGDTRGSGERKLDGVSAGRRLRVAAARRRGRHGGFPDPNRLICSAAPGPAAINDAGETAPAATHPRLPAVDL
jgi:hypothetical protein